MAGRKITRRDFVKESALAAGGLALGASALQAAAADSNKILNFNPNMEYHKAGKSGLMVSAVAMGGHWKRIEKMIPTGTTGKAIFGGNLEGAEFQQNRRDVVSKCMEVGINWIDACTCDEVKATPRPSRAAATRCTWPARGMSAKCGTASAGPRRRSWRRSTGA